MRASIRKCIGYAPRGVLDLLKVSDAAPVLGLWFFGWKPLRCPRPMRLANISVSMTSKPMTGYALDAYNIATSIVDRVSFLHATRLFCSLMPSPMMMVETFDPRYRVDVGKINRVAAYALLRATLSTRFASKFSRLRG